MKFLSFILPPPCTNQLQNYFRSTEGNNPWLTQALSPPSSKGIGQQYLSIFDTYPEILWPWRWRQQAPPKHWQHSPLPSVTTTPIQDRQHLMWIQVFWGVTLCNWVRMPTFRRTVVPPSAGLIVPRRTVIQLFFIGCLTLKMKTLQSFETSGITCPVILHPSPEDVNLQQWCYTKPRSSYSWCTVNRALEIKLAVLK
jgi:hypothetical protein